MSEVYFSQIRINDKCAQVPAKSGWFEAENLRLIHAMRYKPEYKSETEFTYQPQIFREESNDLLASIAGGKFEAETVFTANGKPIKSGCWIEAKGRNLKEVGVNKSKKIQIEKYIDCDTFFYPANRNPVLNVRYSQTSDGDNTDAARGYGFNESHSINIFEPNSVYFEFDYARLYQDPKATEILNRIDEVFKQFGAKIKFVIDVFKATKGLLINGSAVAQYRVKETLHLVLDLLIRLSGIRKCDTNASAIVLIENPKSLLPEILENIFPKIQFIVN